jgi:hypothetical protein
VTKRIVFVGLILGLTISGAGIALAKGASGASISGPGLEGPVELSGMGELGQGTNFSKFVEQSGFFDLVYVMEGPSKITEKAPEKPDGRVYEVVWQMGDAQIRSQIYPDTEGGPLVYLGPGQAVPGEAVMTTNGGWFQASPALRKTLEELGVPLDESLLISSTSAEARPPATVLGSDPTLESGPGHATAGAVAAAPNKWIRDGLALVIAAGLVLALTGGMWATRRRPRRLRAR